MREGGTEERKEGNFFHHIYFRKVECFSVDCYKVENDVTLSKQIYFNSLTFKRRSNFTISEQIICNINNIQSLYFQAIRLM